MSLTSKVDDAMGCTREKVIAWGAWLMVFLLLASCVSPVPSPPTPSPPSSLSSTPSSTPLPSPSPPPKAEPRLEVEIVATKLEVPWDLAFSPDGRLFFAERPGRLQVWEPGKPPNLLASLEVAAVGEAGLLGLALSPTYPKDRYLYVYYTYREGSSLKNRVVGLTVQGDRAISPVVLLEGIPGAPIHDGGRIRFGPDGKLYITTGDATQANLAQDPLSLAGKILRLNPDGTIPTDNPFPNSPVYSMGHRNPQGLAWHPTTGQLYSVEHGPTGHDELNLIKPGGNYGWPQVSGAGQDPRFLNPIMESGTDTWAPSGTSFYQGNRLGGWQGDLVFAALRGQALHRVTLKAPQFQEVAVHQVLWLNEFGRLRDVASGPDGFLYFTTSNRDGRGVPVPQDDRILRVVAR